MRVCVENGEFCALPLWSASFAWPTEMGCFPPSGVSTRPDAVRLSPYPRLKMWFRWSTLHKGRGPADTVAEFFAKQDTEWYSAGIHKLILCYNKCLDEQGDYVGK